MNQSVRKRWPVIGERLNATQADLVTVAPFRAWPSWRGARPRQPLALVYRGAGKDSQYVGFAQINSL